MRTLLVGQKYILEELREIFENRSFMRGINICNRKNCIVLLSNMVRRVYKDNWNEGVYLYTGEDRGNGDQRYSDGNKAIGETLNNRKEMHLFIGANKNVSGRVEYVYYGKVELAGKYFLEKEINSKGISRNVFKFPLRVIDNLHILNRQDLAEIRPGGANEPKIVPQINVVGAVIVRNDRILCCQRGHGSLAGKWEFAGGKIEENETPEEAIKREIKEELGIDIKVTKFLNSTKMEDSEKEICLSLYRCECLTDDIKDDEHQDVRWCNQEEMTRLDWADLDKVMLDDAYDCLPTKIVGEPEKYDYLEIQPTEKTKRSKIREDEEFEAANRKMKVHGNQAENAVLLYEIDNLRNCMRPDLANMVKNVSKDVSLGYDILSYKVKNDVVEEKHIEVKFVQKTSNYISFFLTANELNNFKNDNNFYIYCVYRDGKNFKHHVVNRDRWRDEYLKPHIYQVRIRISN